VRSLCADYICRRASHPASESGQLPKQAWDAAESSKRFVDIVTGEPGLYDTQVSSLWDDDAMYIRFAAEEPFVEARLEERGALVFTENAVELMVDGCDCYYELAINALGTIYEVFYIWKDAYHRGGRFDIPEFDVLERNVLTYCGDDDRDPESFWRGTHQRGCRWAFRDWSLPGLCVYVDVDGAINDPTHVDRGWTVEITLPWNDLQWLAGHRATPPHAGDEWRVCFYRIQQLRVGGNLVHPGPIWALRAQGIRDTHRPEHFPRVVFDD